MKLRAIATLLTASAALCLPACGGNTLFDGDGNKSKAGPPPPAVTEGDTHPADSADQTVEDEPRAVDGAVLEIYSISAAKTVEDSLLLTSVTTVASAGSDYVDLAVCPEDQGAPCFKAKTALQRTLLPASEGGRVVIKARACADGDHLKDQEENCGEWITEEFVAPATQNARLLALSAERAEKAAQVRDLAEKVKDILTRFQAEASVCLKHEQDVARIKNIRTIVASVLTLGESLVSLGLGLANQDAKPVSDVDSAAALNRALLGAQGLAKTDPSAAGAAKAVQDGAGHAKAGKPVSGLQTLTDALFDIFAAEKTTERPCLAEQRAASELKAIETELNLLKARSEEIDAALKKG